MLMDKRVKKCDPTYKYIKVDEDLKNGHAKHTVNSRSKAYWRQANRGGCAPT
jgi:hypothetical protein